MSTLGKRGLQDALQVCLSVRMTDKIKRTDIQRGEIVPVFVRAGWFADDDRGNFNRPALQQANDVAIGAVDQPEAAEARGYIFLGEQRAHFADALRPKRAQRIHLQQIAHAVADDGVNRRHQHGRLSERSAEIGWV